MNAGIQKQLMKNKANLRLSVRDILYTRPAKGNINFQNTEASFRERRDSRFVTLSFTYRFGKPIKGLPKRKTGEQEMSKTASRERINIRTGIAIKLPQY
jgi:hypothetical protein